MQGLALLTLGAFVVALGGLALLVLPARQAVRVRNAFLLRRGRMEDFTWTPTMIPATFRVERTSPPAIITQAVEEAGVSGVDGDWPRALALVSLLLRHAQHERPIRADLGTTWRGILAGSGYCADYVRVYLAAAVPAGLFCRQWAFSFDGFGGHGHTVVEIWDRQRQRWALVDVYNNVFAVRPGHDAPLDALALREALSTLSPKVEFRRAGEGRLGYVHADKLLDYYRQGSNEWYLWFGNDVASRERTGVTRPLAAFSGRLAHRVSSALGRLPPLVVMVLPENEAAVARMETLRRRVCLALASVLALAAVILLQGARDHA